MAFEGTPKAKTLRSILEQAYQVDSKPVMEAVLAGEYFINMYENWRQVIEAIPDPEDKQRLDFVVIGILTGEAPRNPAFANEIADLVAKLGASIKDPVLNQRFYNLIVSIMSGEIQANPFVMEHRYQIGAALIVDCFNESARHQMQGKAKESSDICRWSILSVIATLVSGMQSGMSIALNLRHSLSLELK